MLISSGQILKAGHAIAHPQVPGLQRSVFLAKERVCVFIFLSPICVPRNQRQHLRRRMQTRAQH
jgi:hypothetical protein